MDPVTQRSEVQAEAMASKRQELAWSVQESLFDWPAVKKKKKSWLVGDAVREVTWGP